jgi:hypothetical protein
MKFTMERCRYSIASEYPQHIIRRVDIVSHIEKTDPVSGNKHVEYEIALTTQTSGSAHADGGNAATGTVVAHVFKRYSDFAVLQRHIESSVHVGCELLLPKLPGKSLLQQFNSKFIDKRRESLEDWCNRVAQLPRISTNPDHLAFFGLLQTPGASDHRAVATGGAQPLQHTSSKSPSIKSHTSISSAPASSSWGSTVTATTPEVAQDVTEMSQSYAHGPRLPTESDQSRKRHDHRHRLPLGRDAVSDPARLKLYSQLQDLVLEMEGRRDVVLCQALTLVVAAFFATLEAAVQHQEATADGDSQAMAGGTTDQPGPEPGLESIRLMERMGFVVVWESLLSTYGSE